MNNKNEKTFADLFSSVDDSENKEVHDNNKNATFDSLVNEMFSDNNDSISFGDINDVTDKKNDQVSLNVDSLDTNTDIKDDIKNSIVVDEVPFSQKIDNVVNETIKEDVNENFVFGNIANVVGSSSEADVSSETENMNNLFFNNEGQEKKEESIDELADVKESYNSNNIYFSDKLSDNEDTKLESNIFFDNKKEDVLEDVKKEKIDSNSLVEENNESNNPFFSSKMEKDNKINVELKSYNDNKELIGQDSKISENDILGFDNKNEVSYSNENLFVSSGNGQLNGESINQILVDNENKKVLEEKTAPQSVSPFFQDSDDGLEKIEQNILGSKISFDQTMKVNSKVDKIDFAGTKNFNVKLVKKKVPLIKFLMGVMSYAFFIFLVLILVTLLAYVLDIKIRAAKGDYSAPKFNAYVVLTGSMLPEIQVKDVVVTKKVEADTLKVGDIITFASSDSRFAGTIITHRILKKNQDVNGNITFQTKGDNNNVADSALVQPNNIYGKVILKIPKLGYLQDFLATQGGWIIVILLPCVTVISYDILKLVKGLKRRANKIKVIK